MIPIGDADYSFIAAAAQHLHPVQRPVFAERVRALLQDIADPGPGDIDRAVRAALQGIWEPGAGDIWPALAGDTGTKVAAPGVKAKRLDTD